MKFKHFLLFGLFALIFTFTVTRSLVERPGYTDAYYYFNAANRLVQGDGLTDTYLWTYNVAPETLPAPSHLYWMPLTSLVAALGMLFSPGSYMAAQFPFVLMWAGAALVGFWLGGELGGTNRHRWVAGLLVLFSGFFVRFWGMTDTFAPYALVGALALIFMGRGNWLLAGVFAGLGHLTRADGLLLLLVGWLIILWQTRFSRKSLNALALLTVGYLLMMAPWFLRNLQAGVPLLPVGGAQAMWYTSYNDLFNYPPGADLQTFLESGVLFESRWQAFTNNLGTFIAVEGLVVVMPFMLIGLWNRRRLAMLWPFALYALGLHVAMTFVFPFPGYRGGLYHSAAALVPWWAALAVVGLDDAIEWIAKHRRNWNARTAKPVFSMGLVCLALLLTFSLSSGKQVRAGTPGLYQRISETLPEDARVMINDPAGLYYFTGLGGVVIPNAAPEIIPEIARRYDIDYLIVETAKGIPAVPSIFLFDLNNPPDYLIPIDLQGARLYAIVR